TPPTRRARPSSTTWPRSGGARRSPRCSRRRTRRPTRGRSWARTRSRSTASVPIHRPEPLVADPEVVGDLVQDDASDLLDEALRIGAIVALQRAAVDGDLVREHGSVRAAAPRQRDALVETEKRLAGRRLVLDDDRHAPHVIAKLRRKGVERVLDAPLEADLVHPGHV